MVERLEQAEVAVDAGVDGVGEAREAAEAAGGPEQFTSMLQVVFDGLDDAWRSLYTLKSSVDMERQEAANWGN